MKEVLVANKKGDILGLIEVNDNLSDEEIERRIKNVKEKKDDWVIEDIERELNRENINSEPRCEKFHVR